MAVANVLQPSERVQVGPGSDDIRAKSNNPTFTPRPKNLLNIYKLICFFSIF